MITISTQKKYIKVSKILKPTPAQAKENAEHVRDTLKALKTGGKSRDNAEKEQIQADVSDIDNALISNSAKTEGEALNLAKSPNLLNAIVQDVQIDVAGEEQPIKTIVLCAVGNYVENQASTSFVLVASATSGAGKDYIIRSVLKRFPQENNFKFDRISERALNYLYVDEMAKGEFTWTGKNLYLEDVEDDILNSSVLKTFISTDGDANIATVEKAKVVNLRIVGSPSLFISTAQGTPDTEMTRRLPNFKLNETSDQTKDIYKKITKKSNGETPPPSPVIPAVFRTLKRVNVFLPFGDELADKFAHKELIGRTVYSRFLDYVKAHASLYQHQREMTPDNKIIARKEDYTEARNALLSMLSDAGNISLQSFSANTIEFINGLKDLEKRFTKEETTTTTVKNSLGVETPKVETTRYKYSDESKTEKTREGEYRGYSIQELSNLMPIYSSEMSYHNQAKTLLKAGVLVGQIDKNIGTNKHPTLYSIAHTKKIETKTLIPTWEDLNFIEKPIKTTPSITHEAPIMPDIGINPIQATIHNQTTSKSGRVVELAQEIITSKCDFNPEQIVSRQDALNYGWVIRTKGKYSSQEGFFGNVKGIDEQMQVFWNSHSGWADEKGGVGVKYRLIQRGGVPFWQTDKPKEDE